MSTAIAVVLAGLAVAACGSSNHKTATAAHHTTATKTTHASTGASAATATTPTVTSGPVHATLKGANHTPTAGKKWSYTVTATTSSGKPLTGIVQTEFAFAGLVVGHESPPVHKLKHGVLHDKVTFPASAVGHQLTLVTVIRTSAGSVALGWPVSTHK